MTASDLRTEIENLKRTLAERVAELRIVQRQLDNYSEIETNRRSIAEHLLLDAQVSGGDREDAAQSEELARITRENEQLRKELEEDSAHLPQRAVMEEVRNQIRAEKSRASDIEKTMEADAAVHADELTRLQSRMTEINTEIGNARERAEDRRKAWRISIEADELRAAKLEREVEATREKAQRGAAERDEQVEKLATAVEAMSLKLEEERTRLASQYDRLASTNRLSEALRNKIGHMQQMLAMQATSQPSGQAESVLANFEPGDVLDFDSLLAEEEGDDTRGPEQ